MDKLPPGTDLNTIPATSPPPGVKPNFNAPAPLADISIVVVSIVIFLELLFLSIRVFTKLKAKIGILFEDWCAIIAAILSIGLSAALILGRHLGKHTWDVSIAQAIAPRGAKIIFAQVMLTGPANYMGKLSLLALFDRIFGHIPNVRYQIWAAAVIGLIIPIMTPLDAVACSPPNGAPWGTPNPNCIKTFKYGLAQGLSSLLIDLFILILPIPIILRLNLARRKKIGILFIFMFGILAVVADIVVFKFRIDMFRNHDINFAGYVILLCSVVETGISVACSSMPTIAKFSKLPFWETGYFFTLRSLLRSSTRRSGRSGESSRTPSKNPSNECTPKMAPKKRDPYSINMPTVTDGSVTHLTLNKGDGYIELGDYQSARKEPEINGGHAAGDARFGGRGIQRTLIVEQSYHAHRSPSPRGMV